MAPRDLYGLAVRIAGLVFWVFGAFGLIHLVARPLGMPYPSRMTQPEAIVTTVSWFILGVAATFSAEVLTRLAYGKRQ